VIELDPGMAFGTGQHATTALCLEILEGAPRGSVLDVGSGSGILAIAAAKLGATRIVAIDNDPPAVQATGENAAQNGVGDLVEASGADLSTIDGRFDWVVANIIAPTLIELAEPLVAHMAPGGVLLLSGVLASQEAEVVAAMRAVRPALAVHE